MRVGLSLLYAHPRIGGAWNYIANVVQALSEADRTNQYIAYVHSASRCLVPQQPNFETRLIRVNGQRRIGRVIAEHVLLPWYARHDHLDVMHWFGNISSLIPAPARNVVTIYDIKSFEEGFRRGFAWRDIYMRAMIPQTIRRASCVLPMSQATEHAIRRYFHRVDHKLCVVRTPIGERFRRIPVCQNVTFRDEHSLPLNYWLYVSHFYPHKNHKRLFEAYARVRAECPETGPLVLCGNNNGAGELLAQWIGEAGIAKQVIWLTGLKEEEMPLLYSGAAAMIFASEYEGGGIPVMEAMACGCPVLVSRIPALVEAAGEAGIFFDPTRPEEIAAAVLSFISDPDSARMQSERGLQRVERHRPGKVARELLGVYENVLAH